MSFGTNAGITEGFNDSAVAESIKNPGGQRGGIHGFFERPDGLPCFQAIDDSTYMQLIRKGRVPYFGPNAPVDMGVHRTLAWSVNGRKVKPPNDVEILRAFVDGRTVAGVEPTPAIQAKARAWLAKLYAPWVRDTAISFTCGCGMAFGSRFAFETHELSCASTRGPVGDMPLAVAGVSVGPVEVGPPLSTSSRGADAPAAKLYPCDQCDEGPFTPFDKGRHVRNAHPKPKKRGARRAA